MFNPYREPAVPSYGQSYMLRQKPPATTVAWENPYPGASEAVQRQIGANVASLGPQILGLSHELHANPELGLEEHESVAALAQLLRAHGHNPRVGGYGLETSLLATTPAPGEAPSDRGGRGAETPSSEIKNGPVIAIFAEYDALPEIGHGCGHNVICASAVGAYLALAPLVEELGGQLRLYGTPAEENASGKEIMALAGAFEGVDAALMVHPFSGQSVLTAPYLGLREVEVEFTGVAAHASAMPYAGVNALDAVVSSYQSIGLLRQQLPPDTRIHGIITDGGQRPNVIPERAAAHYYLRAATLDELTGLSQRVQAIMEAAAHATGCRLTTVWDRYAPNLPLRENSAMNECFAAHYTRLGGTIFADDGGSGAVGSTDMGNVSQRLPAIHPMIAIAPAGVALHTQEFAGYGTTEAADAAVLLSANTLAAVAADLLAGGTGQGSLLEAATREFTERGGSTDLSGGLPKPGPGA